MDTNELTQIFKNIGLYYLAENALEFCSRTSNNKLSPYQMLEQIARLEQEEKVRRGLVRRFNAADLGRYKSLHEFDWAWPKKINREAIEDLMTLKFIEEPANVVFFGASGTGKTMLAKNIAYAAISSGHTALFTTASDMLSDLQRQESPRLLKLRMARYVKPKVLIIDEVGYLSYTSHAADLMFQLINARQESSSTVITTNLGFKDWSQIFPGSACLIAMLDRLTHRAEIITIDAESWRTKEANERKNKKSKKNGDKDETKR